MVLLQFFQFRLFLLPAFVHMILAPVIKRTILRAKCRVRWKSLNRDQYTVPVIIQSWDRPKQSSCIWMFRIFKQSFCIRCFNNTPRIHNINTLCKSCYNTQVMGNDHYCCIGLFSNITDHFQDLCLGSNIKSCCSLICNKNRGFRRHRHCDHDPLAHTT